MFNKLAALKAGPNIAKFLKPAFFMEHIVAAYARKKFRMTKYHVKSQLLDWVYINIQMNRGRDRGKSEFLNS